MPVSSPVLEQRIAAVRAFNRFYTRQIGLLQESLYQSQFSLTEGRVLYELANRDTITASELGQALGLDAGYLSRMLSGFERRGFLQKEKSVADGRQSLLRLTEKGRKVFTPLDRTSHDEVAVLLQKSGSAEQERLIAAMEAIQGILGERSESKQAYTLRQHRPGDIGWVIHRHGVLYSQERGYDEQFEALVAEIAANFIQNFDAKRERCWIAEKDGERVGCVFLVKKSKTVAKLRMLLVEPSARGLGLGKRLAEECIRFAREAGYKKITLWTQSDLDAARGIYKNAGFRLVQKKKHHSFGQALVAEIWDLKL
jgi:DNA-binding MarR family transcriptional regulator/N-acetylglutamate synthase-like GNAT family acetyltransferase